jgi:hypothetical protein
MYLNFKRKFTILLNIMMLSACNVEDLTSNNNIQTYNIFSRVEIDINNLLLSISAYKVIKGIGNKC